MDACLRMPLERDPGHQPEYSDIGFVLLGAALCQLAGRPLDHLAEEMVFRPLQMASTGYVPAAESRADIAPTCDWNMRHRVLQGEVHDENCALLGGVAGHTGLFSNCADVLRFAGAVLRQDGFFMPHTVELFSRRVCGSRALGWDTPSQPSQSGQYFSPRSIGHLGYSGTSLWIDLDRKIAITLLTNRCYTGPAAGPLPDKHAIGRMRPAFHDAVMRELVPGL
jgi:CubicO group peptidase (beta-lactamase class C family)